MNDWAELGRALGALQVSGRGEIREDGEWFADLGGLHCEFHTQGKNPLVQLWTGERNLTRRILRIREQSKNRIVLEVQRFGRAKPGRLEFLRTDSRRGAGRISREEFRVWLKRFLAEQFPDATVESLTTAPDLEHSFSGLYVRGRMRDGPRMWAVLAVSSSENAASIEGILASGILWLDWTRSHAERPPVEGLRLFVPEGAGRVVSQRAFCLSPAARTEIFEFRERDLWIRKVGCADAGNLESWLVPRQEAESSIEAARRAIARIHPLALHLPPAGDDISVRSASQLGEVALCFRGLEFGRWSPEGISFGLSDARQRLSEATEPTLDALMRELDKHRSPHSSDTNHPPYRAAPERWIETLVLQDPTRLDAQLDPRHFYSQVPALAAGDRGVLDLLGVTRRGRLVVIELKASEDNQLPMQAVDYWLRVRRHQRDGDFEHSGYFVGAPLDPRPPLVWLVAPALRFHSATETPLKYLSPEIQVTRIGLNEHWRRGLKVMFRQ